MNTINKHEKGQAIVMIAFAIMGLFALIALAMDGGHAFSDRRQAQNAADAAAIAVASRYAQDQTQTLTSLSPIALTSASRNGYDNTMPRSTVVLTNPRPATVPDECSEGGEVYQVDIDSYLPTWFAPIIGVAQVHNSVSSTALGCKPYRSDAFNGNAVVALNPNGAPTGCKSLTFAGSSNTTITSTTHQGLYVRSSCNANDPNNPQNALNIGSGNVSVPNISVVGGIFQGSGTTTITDGGTIKTGVKPFDENAYSWPDPVDICPSTTSTVVNGDTLTPGVYPGTNGSWSNTKFPPNSIHHLQAGIYCLDNEIQATGGDWEGSGVTIVQRTGTITINGGTITVSAPTSGPTAGLLFYMPKSNPDGDYNSGINIQGNGTSTYQGSIIAPSALISVAGTSSSTGTFQSQLVGYNVSIGGGGGVSLNYDSTSQYKPPHQATIQLLK